MMALGPQGEPQLWPSPKLNHICEATLDFGYLGKALQKKLDQRRKAWHLQPWWILWLSTSLGKSLHSRKSRSNLLRLN